MLSTPAAAQTTGLVPCTGNNCNICHIVQLLVNIGQFLLGIVGSVALAMFLYGAFWWIISVGDPKRVQKGKDIILNAIYGVFLTFGAYLIITFAIGLLTGTNPYETSQKVLFGKTWGELLTCEAPTCVASGGTCQPSCAVGTVTSYAFEECRDAQGKGVCCLPSQVPAAATSIPAPATPTAPATATPTAPTTPALTGCTGWGGVCGVFAPGDPDPAGKTCRTDFSDCTGATHRCCK